MVAFFQRLLKLPDDHNGLLADWRDTLSSRIMIVILLATLVYYFVDRLINSHVTDIIFIGIAYTCVLSLALNGLGYFKLSKIVSLTQFNFILYNVSASEPYATGVHLHLFTVAFIALALFGYESRTWGFVFIIFSFSLYLLSYFHIYSFLPQRSFITDQTTVFFFVNATIFGIVNISLFVMMLRLNYKAEKKLIIKNQEIVKKNEGLIKVNAELDRFVYSASHDLRAPLTSISGLIHLQKMEQPSSPFYLDMIQGRVAVMDKFIHDIIDYSQNTRIQVFPETFQLEAMVAEIIENLKMNQLNERLKIRIDIDDTLVLTADISRLRIALKNLIANAIKYSNPMIEDPYVLISAFSEMDRYTIEVKDNGIGIEKKYQPKVFEMFYRATASASGSGLGLYIARESLAKINGTISFESEIGEGSVFRVTLPA